ncbi:MAG TPA: amidase, partial [Bryobacteraceae bacterium]|nr:amidase [Bryobacteraceae bacterium]
MLEILQLSAGRQAALIRERRISSVELVTAHLQQIDTVNPAIHAAVDVLAERALAMAAATDEATARGQEAGPLTGVPFSVKDSIEVEGTRCTAGTFGRRNAAKSTFDAEVVRRLRQAGGIPIAKTNLPDLLFAFETDNLLYGATRNPYGLERTCGGSSGGEAALIAACGSPCGLGSDAAGSVRLPAAFCGIAAIKPTSGRLPRTGHFPPAGGWIEALWQIGPMARRAEDLPLLMELLAGGDGADQAVIDIPFRDSSHVNLADLRIAFYTTGAPSEAVRRAAAALESQVRFMEESRPGCLEEAYDL